jgi:hypothetical protein
MNNAIRSDSDSESAKQGVYALTTTPIISNRRTTTTGNVHEGSIYYPTVSEVLSSNRSITSSAST